MNRRNFIRSASALSTLTILKPEIVFASNNNSAVRIGLIGCGSRATGVLWSMAENSNIRVTALADLFDDKLQEGIAFTNGLNQKKGYTPAAKANTYPGEINVSVHSSKFGNVFGDVCARFVGTEGIAEAHYSGGVYINGTHEWDSGIVRSTAALTPESIAQGASSSSLDDADPNKGKAFIESITSGKYLNQLESGCHSTLTAILGREAASKQEKVTWDELVYTPHKIDPNLDLTQFTGK